jgi:tetratricopeptide (TPR) repeat protein
LACAGAACGAARAPRPSPGSPGDPAESTDGRDSPSMSDARRIEHESLEHYMARVRVLAEKAASSRQRPLVRSLEADDPVLRKALARLAASSTPAHHRDVATAYRRAGIADLAFDHYTAAVRLDRTDAAAYDGLARIWRDWGWPHLGLVEAHRAVFHDPGSSAAHNTLGTILQALRQPDAARREYELALALDPRAAYALNNLCTLDLAAGRVAAAVAGCERALALDPTLLAARRNLATLNSLRPVAEPLATETIEEPAPAAPRAVRPPGE